MSQKLITIYALLNGSTSSSARKLVADGQATTRKARAEQSKAPPAKRKGKKARRMQ